MPSSPNPPRTLLELGDEVLAFLLGAVCAGCGTPGTLLCRGCRRALVAHPFALRTPAGHRAFAALGYEGEPAACIRRLKEGDTMLARPLGHALAEAAALSSPAAGDAVFVPIPTRRAAFRSRGFRVPELLLARAGLPWRRLLLPGGAVRDQRGLGRSERARNVRGSMRVAVRGTGEEVVVVDDVLTTGATVDEGARMLRSAGFRIRGIVTLAATPSRPR